MSPWRLRAPSITVMLVLALAIPQRAIAQPAPGSSRHFYLGWYDAATHPETAALVAPQGIDLLVPYVSTLGNDAIARYLDAADVAGVKVILEVPRSIVKSGNSGWHRRFR